ncbi:hypothetical protein pb186bvf_005874 [Paramecium bursaria]
MHNNTVIQFIINMFQEKKKYDSFTLLITIALLILAHQTYQGPSDASIFQLNQQEQSTDQYFNLDSQFDFQHSAYYEYDKMQVQGEMNYIQLEEKSKRIKITSDKKLLQKQYAVLMSFDQNEILAGKEYFSDVIDKAQMLKFNNWNQVFKMKQIPKRQGNQKFLISKNENWEVHLKSIRTHYIQKLFSKLWKVPTQTIIKEFCFQGQSQNKRVLKNHLIEQMSEIKQIYESFPRKLELYSNIINRFIQALDLALSFGGEIDDLIFEVLFKGHIAELFH